MSAEEPSPAPGRFRTTTRSTVRPGEGSFRGLLGSLSKTTDRSANGPTIREMGTAYYLREEMHSARQAVKQLDIAVSEAQSFREAASKLREEAHRAIGRLERAVAQIVDSEHVDPDLIGIACDITCAAKRGITLVDVYGKYSTMVKIMTIFLRSYIHSKFEKQTELLRKLNPPASVAAARRPQLPSPPVTAPAASTPPLGSAAGICGQSAAGPGTANSAPHNTTADTPVPLGRSSVGVVQQQQQPAAQMLVGKVLQVNRHEKVLALAYVPPAAQFQASEYVSIWWSVGQRLEYYSEAMQSTTAFPEACNVTALGVDDGSSVWTGHAKGQVRVRYKLQWERTVESKAFTAAVKAIAFDEGGRAWVGDESGRIKVMAYEPEAGQLETVAALQRSPALLSKMKGAPGSLFGKRYSNSSCNSGQASAASVFAAATAAGTSVTTAAAVAATTAAGRDGSPAVAGVTTAGVTCLPASGGGSGSNVAGSSHHNTPLGTMEGPVRCIFVRGGRAWASGGRSCPWLQLWDVETLQDLDVFDCGIFGPCHAMAALRWPCQIAANASSAGSALHPRPVTLHRHTRSDGHCVPVGGCWRLLTGHDNGQVLLWHPEHRTLAPLLRIGDLGSPCRGIAVFEAYNLVVTGHQGGQLHLFRQPAAETGLPPGSDSASPQSLGTHRPKMVVVSAHKSRLDRMVWGATSCVTASILGTIRLWHAADLASEAQRSGLVFTHTTSYNSLQIGDASQSGVGHYHSASSSILHQRDSAKSLAASTDIPLHASGQMGSPQVLAGPSAAGSLNTSGTASMSTAQSGVMQQMSSAGGPAHQHRRQSSKDSIDTAGGMQPGVVEPLSGASFPHFQTIDYAELQVQRKIGSGAYGEVLLAEWLGSNVAVKKLFAVQNMDDKEYQSLMHEVTLLGSLSHPNIMRFLAMCLDPPCIVMQYYPHGSLFDLLHKAQKGNAKATKELTWSKRLDMLRDVASGMQYLHSRKPPVIHGDLRSPNLLLDLTIDRERPRFHVKIADFGLARLATGATGSVMVSKMTNPRWLAPEVIRNSSVGKAADVYSFSIIMWEMLTWRQPYQDMMSVQVMFSTVTENFRPEVPPDVELPGGPGVSLSLYRQLMERCWQADAAQRPSFKEIVEVFQNMQRVEAESTRQQRQQQQPHVMSLPPSIPPPQQQQLQQGARYAGEIGGNALLPPAVGSTEFAGGSISAPASGSTESSAQTPPAAAAVVAAARRASSTGVASPFMCPPATVELPADPGGGATVPDGRNAPHGNQQYGSVLPMYGMSPILEETASSMTSASQVIAERPAPTPSGLEAGALPAQAEGAVCGLGNPTTSQSSAQSHLLHHRGSLQHPHVHFAPTSPFSPPVAGGAPASAHSSTSCPASPESRGSGATTAAATGPGSARDPNRNPSFSASSTESGFVHAVSAGSNIAGAPSTATSSRQSSTSTSGRMLGAAAAAAVTTAAAAAAASRKAGPAPAAATATPGRSGVPALSSPRRDGGGPSATASTVGGESVPQQAQDTGGGGTQANLWATYSTPMVVAPSITCLSPFASLPAAQLTELDAAAPQVSAAVAEHLLDVAATAAAAAAVTPATAHARPTASPSPRSNAMPRCGGGGTTPHASSRGAAGGTMGRSGHPASPASTAQSSARVRRKSGTPICLGPPARTAWAGGGTPSGTPRSAAGGCNSQPGTPPHRGPTGAPPGSRGSVGHGSRRSSTAGIAAAAGAFGNPGRSPSRDGPLSSSSSGGRCLGSFSASPAASGDTMPRVVSVSAHAPEAAGRQSCSDVQAHVDSHGDHVLVGQSDHPGHRRTPSGGCVGSHAAATAATAVASRTRDCGALAHEAVTATPHSRTHAPFGTRGGGLLASPHVSASNTAAESRAVPAARRNLAGPHGTSGNASAPFEMAGSPSTAPSGHGSRLGMAARSPGSPRSYIPGGPGSSSVHSPTILACSGGMSRIPSLLHTMTHGSEQPVPAKSSTSRSLDDGNLRHLSVCQPAVQSPLRASLAAGAATVGATGTVSHVNGDADGGDAFTAAPAWDEGLDGAHHGPDVTQEGPLLNSEGSVLTANPVSQQQVAEAAGGSSYTSLLNAGETAGEVAVGAWLHATKVRRGSSPFAAAAFEAPFFPGEGNIEADAQASAEAEPQPQAAAEEGGPHGEALNGDSTSKTMTGSGVVMVATSLRAQMRNSSSNAFGSSPSGAAAPAPESPVARIRPNAPQSPFAKLANEREGWWENQQHGD